MGWTLPIVVILESPTLLTTLQLLEQLIKTNVIGEMEKVWVDVFGMEIYPKMMMSTALRDKGILFMHGTNARNCAMINQNVIRLRSKHKRCWVTVIFIVFFTSRMNANLRELIIMYTTMIFEIPSMITLESGVVFVVHVVVERLIMHALALQSHVETVLIHSLAAATVVRLILAVPAAAMEEFNLCGDKRNYC